MDSNRHNLPVNMNQYINRHGSTNAEQQCGPVDHGCEGCCVGESAKEHWTELTPGMFAAVKIRQ